MLFESDRLRLGVSDGVATLWLGDEATRNTIGLRFLQDLDRAISAAKRSPVIDVLVLRSGIAGIFATGPELDELAHLDDAEARLEHAAVGQHVMRRLADLSEQMQTVAVIEGRCSDAGLELALACSHRLAVASPEATLAFDSVRRGAPPCWGGTVRLPQTVGLQAALELFAGAPIPARAAQRIGLIDRLVGARQARTELLWYLAELQDLPHRKPPRHGAPNWWQRLRESLPFSRRIIQRAQRANAGDPIYHNILETVRHGWREGHAEGVAKERRAFASVIDSAESVRRQARARRVDRYLRTLGNVSVPGRAVVVGSDETAIDLTALAMHSGCGVCLFENVPAARQRGETLLQQALVRAAGTGWFNAVEVEAKSKNVFVSATEHRFAENDVVLVAAKAAQGPAALLNLECSLPDDALLVSLGPMPNLAASFAQPQRCVAIHFPEDIAAGCSVELRPSTATSAQALGRLSRWLERCGLHLHEAPALEAARPAVFAA